MECVIGTLFLAVLFGGLNFALRNKPSAYHVVYAVYTLVAGSMFLCLGVTVGLSTMAYSNPPEIIAARPVFYQIGWLFPVLVLIIWGIRSLVSLNSEQNSDSKNFLNFVLDWIPLLIILIYGGIFSEAMF